MAMKLYGMDNFNVQRAILPLFEAEVDVEKELELVLVSLFSQDQLQPVYLSKQPFGQIPYFEDGNVSIFESRAIARYIAEKYDGQGTPSLLGKTLDERAAINQWIESEAHNFYPAVQPMVRELLMARGFKRPVDEDLVAACVKDLNKVLDVYEAHLSKGKSKYLAGDGYSLADACHAPYMNQVKALRPDLLEHRPRVLAWIDDITARPAFQTCQQLDWGSAKSL